LCGKHLVEEPWKVHDSLMEIRTIEPGLKVVVTDVADVDHEVELLHGAKYKGFAFPVAWLDRSLVSGGFEPVPWPAEVVLVASDV